MITDKLSIPKQWEDWGSLALGTWLCVSPWALMYADDSTLTRNAFFVGFLLVATGVAALSAFYVWEEWVNVGLGAWLIVSSFALGITDPLAIANFTVVGVLVLFLAGYELWDVRRHSARPA